MVTGHFKQLLLQPKDPIPCYTVMSDICCKGIFSDATSKRMSYIRLGVRPQCSANMLILQISRNCTLALKRSTVVRIISHNPFSPVTAFIRQYRRQILTYKDGHRAEGIKTLIMVVGRLIT